MSVIVFWRHAPTVSNAEDRIQGMLDVPLGEDGLEKARRAASIIVERHGSDLAIVSSPLSRAQQTAGELAELVGTEITVDAAFNQRSYGVWEGLTREEVQQQWPAEYALREQGLDPGIPGWDGQVDVAERVSAALGRVWDAERPTVIVSHGSPITLGLLALIGEPASSRVLGRVPHAGWAEVRRVESGAWHLDAFALGAP